MCLRIPAVFSSNCSNMEPPCPLILSFPIPLLRNQMSRNGLKPTSWKHARCISIRSNGVSALLPCIAIAIVMAYAIYLYSIIDEGSAHNLSIEASRIIPPKQTSTPSATIATTVTIAATAPSAPTGQTEKKQDDKTQDSKQNPGKSPAEQKKTETTSASPTTAAPLSMEADPAYPLLQPHNILDPMRLVIQLTPPAPEQRHALRRELANTLWNRFSPQTQWYPEPCL